MEAWLREILGSGQAGIVILSAVFLLGMLGILTCACNYAIFAMIIGYSGSMDSKGKRHKVLWAGSAFLFGAVVSMAGIGALFGYAGDLIGARFGTWWQVGAGLFCIFFGLYSMEFLPFRIPALRLKKETGERGLISAIFFGLAVGGLSTAFNSCCNPVFPIILAASFVKGSTVWGLTMLSIFALGYALPLALGMVGLKLGLEKVSRGMSGIGAFMKYGGGILLLVMGFYFILTI